MSRQCFVKVIWAVALGLTPVGCADTNKSAKHDRPFGHSLASVEAGEHPPTPVSKPGYKIIGGRTGARHDWPALAVIRGLHDQSNTATYFCGGTVIAPAWVLTAAHCLHAWRQDREGIWRDPEFGRIEITIGADDLTDSNRIDTRAVKSVIIHPHFQNRVPFPSDDIALIELAEAWSGPPMPLSVGPLTHLAGGTWGRVAGFGVQEEPSRSNHRFLTFQETPSMRKARAGSFRLRQATVPTVSSQSCAAVYPDHNPDREVCVGYRDGGTDSCQGDSGGPFVVKDHWQNVLQVGIVSSGRGCARPIWNNGGYGRYTLISPYIDWIRTHVPDVHVAERQPAPSTIAARDVLETIETRLNHARGEMYVAIKRDRDEPEAIFRRSAPRGTVSQTPSAPQKMKRPTKPKTEFRSGEHLTISIESGVAGQLLVLDINASGDVTVLFPNTYSPASPYIDGAAVRRKIQIPDASYPFSIRAGPPYGDGRVIAFVLPETTPVRLSPSSGARRGNSAPAGPFGQNINNVLQHIVDYLPDHNGQDDPMWEQWAVASARYTITP